MIDKKNIIRRMLLDFMKTIPSKLHLEDISLKKAYEIIDKFLKDHKWDDEE